MKKLFIIITLLSILQIQATRTAGKNTQRSLSPATIVAQQILGDLLVSNQGNVGLATKNKPGASLLSPELEKALREKTAQLCQEAYNKGLKKNEPGLWKFMMANGQKVFAKGKKKKKK